MGRSPAIDQTEIEDLYRRYGALVRRRARSILNDDAEAEDALQEVFVRVIGAMREFRGQSQPSTWLYSITTNLCLNRVRDSKRRRNRLAESAAAEVPPERPIMATPEARTAARAVLAHVSPDLAAAAVYYYIDDMDQAEIAVLLGVSRRTIGYRLDRFREAAQQLLDGNTVATIALPGVTRRKGESE